MQEAQQKKPSFIPPAPAPKDAADQGFAPPRFPVQSHAKQPSASGKATRAYSSYDRDLIQTKLLEGMDRAMPRQGQAEAIQSKDAHCEAEDGVQLKDDGESVQQKSPQDIAADGFRGTPRRLPHLDKIQQSFGQDLSHVQAYTGKEAAAASQKLGAAAYTSGNRIAFAKTPSVGLAAHEAAHVMQQQSGKVQLKDGLGQVGDKYEQHADAVADAVVAGESAKPLLREYTGDTAIAQSMPSVMAQAENAPRQPGAIGQDVWASAEVKLIDERNFGSALAGRGGNLGSEGTYYINPRISATLGATQGKFQGTPRLFLGDKTVGSHVRLMVSNPQTEQRVFGGGHEGYKFTATYTLKNAKTWETPNMNFNFGVHNRRQLEGSLGASGRLPIKKLLPVEANANIGTNFSSEQDFKANVEEFSLGGTNSYYAHTHKISLYISSAGNGGGEEIESGGDGNHTPDGVYVSQKVESKHVEADDGSHSYLTYHEKPRVNMPLQK
ncbi:eCIS core domain-containing protein [Coleofasciculus sp. E2-BRE-01]|uniref:eCIS core domain-containing protein n=1 Tax=Coleofasciculus sp. E2-BRE-01 TaxID=3069524 RepID=UPI0032FCFB93